MLKVLGFFSKFFTKCVGHEEASKLLREKELVIEKLDKNIANKNSELSNLEASYDEVNLKLGEAETKLIAAIAKNSNLEKELEVFNNVSVEAVSEDISEINKLNDEVKGLLSLLKAKGEENALLNSKVKELEKKIKESLNSNEESPDLKRSITKTNELMAENKMLKDKIASLEKQPTDFLNVDALLYSYVNTLSLDKIKETKDAIVAAVQTDNTLLKTINNALKDTDEKSSLKKMLRAIWSRRKKQLNPIYAEISNFGTVTK
jgi:chromosome segregation ATPase